MPFVENRPGLSLSTISIRPWECLARGLTDHTRRDESPFSDSVDGQARPVGPRSGRLGTLGTLGSSPAPALGFSPRRGRTVAGHRSLSHQAMSGTGKAEMTQQPTATSGRPCFQLAACEDEHEWVILVRTYEPYLNRLAASYRLGDDAHDAVQQTFYRLGEQGGRTPEPAAARERGGAGVGGDGPRLRA